MNGTFSANRKEAAGRPAYAAGRRPAATRPQRDRNGGLHQSGIEAFQYRGPAGVARVAEHLPRPADPGRLPVLTVLQDGARHPGRPDTAEVVGLALEERRFPQRLPVGLPSLAIAARRSPAGTRHHRPDRPAAPAGSCTRALVPRSGRQCAGPTPVPPNDAAPFTALVSSPIHNRPPPCRIELNERPSAASTMAATTWSSAFPRVAGSASSAHPAEDGSLRSSRLYQRRQQHLRAATGEHGAGGSHVLRTPPVALHLHRAGRGQRDRERPRQHYSGRIRSFGFDDLGHGTTSRERRILHGFPRLRTPGNCPQDSIANRGSGTR